MYETNPPLDEVYEFYMMSEDDFYDENNLTHYGMPRRSGRYPWGSGENPYQHSADFMARVQSLRKSNATAVDESTGEILTGERAIAKIMGLANTKELRVQYALAKDEKRTYDVQRARSLRDDGKSLNEIASIMGFKNDSSVRSLLNEQSASKMNKSKKTAETLKECLKEKLKDDPKAVLDVGVGVERELGVSKEKLNEALYILQQDGYQVWNGSVPQATNPGKKTNLRVIGPEGTPKSAPFDYDHIHSVSQYTSRDGGETFTKTKFPESMDSKRLAIRYAEDGGTAKDGVIELRRGVKDLDLGESNYAQVRILVDGDRYLKGMAVYSDNLPKGVDVLFNTNKTKDKDMRDVLKEVKRDKDGNIDQDNPFGALIKANGQSEYIGSDGKSHQSLINKTREEGDWSDWTDKLSSQFLAKQNIGLIKQQIKMAIADKQAEFDDIMALTNPTVKKNLLESFANNCDSVAVHLDAAALPRQKYHVILPLTSISDKEVYAPGYKNGETVALVRFPHGGTFEIPILKVNNKLKEGQDVLGNSAKDAIGISSHTAGILSGADFDGDTVMVIPCNSANSKIKISHKPPLKGLEGFEPKDEYGSEKVTTDAKGNKHYYRNGVEFKVMKNTQTEMGIISNLITDMTLKGATEDELARAVRHSMVVIDAEKHKLDYKASYADNAIASLKKKYQGVTEADGTYHEGAGTLLSRAKSKKMVLKRVGTPKIDPETGELRYKEVTETFVDKKTGKTRIREQESTKMAETRDAHTLSSGHPKEEVYADYANTMKAMANQARKEILSAGKIEYDKSARTTYQKEVSDLMAKLNMAMLNAPKERRAQIIAASEVKAKQQANPDMTKKELKKAKQVALNNARYAVGASGKDSRIVITDKEWAAIQAGAISETKLKQILTKADPDRVRELATPRTKTGLSSGKVALIKSMAGSNYSLAEIAERLGVSPSTVNKYL